MTLGASCAVSGTGFMFSREILARCGGWKFFLLTEDIEFTIANITFGIRIGYCPDAEFFDEQPVTFRQSWRQRMRWARGYLQVFGKYGGRLLRGIFTRRGFSCYDMTMSILPAIVLVTIGILSNLCVTIYGIISGQNLWIALESIGEMLWNSYRFMFIIGIITTITEWEKIHTSTLKKIVYTFNFPLFMMTYIPISFTALFRHVEWKPIEHRLGISVREIAGK